MKLNDARDDFAGIAQHAIVLRDQIIEPAPAALPTIVLPLDAPEEARTTPRLARAQSVEDFRRELDLLKEAMRPYEKNLAPPFQARARQILHEAQWRQAESDHPSNTIEALAGQGPWTSIQLPHYGGPIGRATAFYRMEVKLEAPILSHGGRLFLCFRAADYRAQVYLNGHFLCEHEGFFDPFEVDVTGVAHEGINVLLVKLDNDAICRGNDSWHQAEEGEKIYAATGLGWDEPGLGWHHCPPGMGLYQQVYFEARPALYLDDLWVRPQPREDQAELLVYVGNTSGKKSPVKMAVSVFGQNFEMIADENGVSHDFPDAGPGRTRYRVPLPLKNFRPWTPETPWLYQVQVRLGGDVQSTTFGMRTFQIAEEDGDRGRLFLNGEEIRLRGANTMGHEQQCVFQGDLEQLREDILIAKYAGLNFLRITQRPVQPEVYEACDQLGMMVQTDLPLFGKMRWTQFAEGVRQAAAMERLIRGHASCVLVSLINEPFPAAWGDSAHRHFSRTELDAFLRACEEIIRCENPDRQIKPKDGDYEPPSEGLPDNHCYCGWYAGHGLDLGKLHRGYWQGVKPGWRYACGEFGAEGLDSTDLMRRRYPQDWLTKAGGNWTPLQIPYAQTGKMQGLWMDSFDTMEDWVSASQAHQAWVVRLMTRAFRRDRRMVSFALHLLIDAFPAGWMKAVVDCERNPKPAYFEYRDALRTLLVDVRADRQGWFGGETFTAEVWICHDAHRVPKDLFLHYTFSVDAHVLISGRTKATVPTCDSQFQGTLNFLLPSVTARTSGLLRVALVNEDDETLEETEESFSLHPPEPSLAKLSIRRPSPTDEGASRLLEELNVLPQNDSACSVIISSDAQAFELHRAEINAGATLLLVDLPAGEYTFEGQAVSIQAAGYGPRHFVSRATGHSAVEGFEPNDFRFWHDPQADAVSPLLDHLIVAEGWTPILSTQQAGWGETSRPAWACAERRVGLGRLILCQLKLVGRLKTNPVALKFVRQLLAPALP